MAKQQRTWGIFIIQLSLAIYLVVTGLFLITSRWGASISSYEVGTLASFLPKGAREICSIILGIILILCGVCFLIKAFGKDLGKFDDIVKIITLIIWVVVTVVALISYAKTDFAKGGSIFHWLLALAKNCLIIGGIMTIKKGE